MRRNVLKSAAVLGFGVPVFIKSVTADPQRPDVSFDPSSTTETRQFVKNSFEYSKMLNAEGVEEERSRIVQSLSKRQAKAIEPYITTSQLVLESATDTGRTGGNKTDNFSSGQVTTASSCTTYSHTLSAYIQTPVGEYHAFDFTHEIDWCYDNDDYWGMQAHATGDGRNYALVNWDYNGSIRDDFAERSTYFLSQKEGEFDRCAYIDFGWNCTTDYGFIELSGDIAGYGFVQDKKVY